MKIASASIASLFGMIVAVPFAFAEPNGGERPPHPHRPPEEAFTACANLAEGDACTVKHHDHEMTGQCRKVPDHVKGGDAGKLVCAPPHGHRPPPPPQ